MKETDAAIFPDSYNLAFGGAELEYGSGKISGQNVHHSFVIFNVILSFQK